MIGYCARCMSPMADQYPCSACGYDGKGNAKEYYLRPGTILCDRYMVGNAIGQGGFGITYIGRDLRLDMRIAVKEYYPYMYAARKTDDGRQVMVAPEKEEKLSEGKKRFMREARVLAGFHDLPGIVDVRDFFEENNTAYIVMEYLDGEDLRHYVSHNRFDADDLFRLMIPVFDAMEWVHAKNVIHRDISPDNLMLLRSGSIKLMDFGAAREADEEWAIGAPLQYKAGYAPEEQYRAKSANGPWLDIYALCATMYKCITGITPREAPDREYEDSVVWPSAMNLPIQDWQEKVLKKGMAVRRADRYKSIAELKQDIPPLYFTRIVQSAELQMKKNIFFVQQPGSSSEKMTVSMDEEAATKTYELQRDEPLTSEMTLEEVFP